MAKNAVLKMKQPDMKRIKAQAAAARVPQTLDEVNAAIAQIGRLERDRTRIEADMNDKIAGMKLDAESLAAPLNDQLKALQEGVQIWCEAHRDELTNSGKVKSAQLAAGEVIWRMDPPSVKAPSKGKKLDELLALLKAKECFRFVRSREDLNKEAMLNEPQVIKDLAIKGLSIEQGEQFVIVPFNEQLEEVRA